MFYSHDWSGRPADGNPFNGMRLSGKYGLMPAWQKFMNGLTKPPSQKRRQKTLLQISRSNRKALVDSWD